LAAATIAARTGEPNMRHNLAVALLSVALLSAAACNSGPEVSAENASAEDVAKEVAEAGGAGSFVSPGKWESKLTLLEMSMPGMPPEAAAQMKKTVGTSTHLSCLTAEQARRPKEDFFAGANKNCRYDRFSMGQGKIDAVMNCKDAQSSQTMVMAGTYSANAYAMTMTATGAQAGAADGMKMRMSVEAKRLGACDGTEESS
jgi:hypothetical protein